MMCRPDFDLICSENGFTRVYKEKGSWTWCIHGKEVGYILGPYGIETHDDALEDMIFYALENDINLMDL